MDTGFKQINIPGLEYYRINRDGVVMYHNKDNNAPDRIINTMGLTSIGYPCYKLHNWLSGKRHNYTVHRLLALTFIPKPVGIKTEVNHIDHNKENYSLDNLEWITHKENIQKARAVKSWTSGRPKGYRAHDETKRKMSEKKKQKVVLTHTDGHTVKLPSINDAAAFFGISRIMFFLIRRAGLNRNGYTIQIP